MKREKMNFDLNSNKLEMTCIYHTGLDDWRGGTAILKDMIHIFKRLGIKTNLIAYYFSSDKFRIEHKKIDSLLESTTVHLNFRLPDFLKAISIFLVFIYAWRSAKKCDLIFADVSILTATIAVILGKIFRKPVILHYIDEERVYVPNIIYNFITKNVDLVFAISPYLIDKAKNYGCKNIVYLPPFADTNLFNMNMDSRKKIRVDLRIKEDDIVIGYAGSFRHHEGLTVLLQTFKSLLKKYLRIKLCIKGRKMSKKDDNILKFVKDLEIADRVTIIPPQQPHEEVPKFLSACDITCCPRLDCEYNRASNPIKVVEYLSMGLPTVCSSVGGITYTIEDGVDGFLVKPGDVKDLEKKLEWIILNPERAKKIGKNGRKKAIEKYSFDVIENTVRQAISEIIYQKRGMK